MALSSKETRIPIRREGDPREEEADPTQRETAPTSPQDPLPEVPAGGDAGVDWRDTAMRLRADMENYRKRQKRWAEDEVVREKAELLTRFLVVIDDLERALEHLDPTDPAHQGVQVAYDGILNLLLREGVERIFAKGQVFDPHKHEAVAVVPAQQARDDELRVVEVTSPGYTFEGRVLRPAKVVVAKPAA